MKLNPLQPTKWVLLFLACVGLNDSFAIAQEPIKSDIQIQEKYQEQLKAAAKGQAADFETLREELEETIDKQISDFIDKMNDGDASAKEVADAVESSMSLREDLLNALRQELEVTPMSDMEATSFRETLHDLGVHIGVDYSIVASAISSENKLVRIRLPDLHVCGGCKVKLESALKDVDGFEQPIVNLKTMTAQFVAPVDYEIESKLDEMEKSVNQLKNWKLVRE